ncbi:MAG TPA: hypothetical protein VIF62_09500, partial [Labilithrix sp.]
KSEDASTDAQTVGSVAGVTDMVAAGSSLYFGTAGGLQKMPTAGGSPMSVFQEEGVLGGMITDGHALYWTSQSDAGSHTTRFGLDSFGALAHSANVAAPSWVAVDEGFVYDFDANAGLVRRMNKSTLAPPETLATITDKTFLFAAGATVDETNVYFSLARTIDYPRDLTLVKVPKCGGDPVILGAYGGGFGTGIFVDATYVYFADEVPAGSLSRVLRVAK